VGSIKLCGEIFKKNSSLTLFIILQPHWVVSKNKNLRYVLCMSLAHRILRTSVISRRMQSSRRVCLVVGLVVYVGVISNMHEEILYLYPVLKSGTFPSFIPI
jgi:hypothetical protein